LVHSVSLRKRRLWFGAAGPPVIAVKHLSSDSLTTNWGSINRLVRRLVVVGAAGPFASHRRHANTQMTYRWFYLLLTGVILNLNSFNASTLLVRTEERHLWLIKISHRRFFFGRPSQGRRPWGLGVLTPWKYV